jgi:hypothetical protein
LYNFLGYPYNYQTTNNWFDFRNCPSGCIANSNSPTGFTCEKDGSNGYSCQTDYDCGGCTVPLLT